MRPRRRAACRRRCSRRSRRCWRSRRLSTRSFRRRCPERFPEVRPVPGVVAGHRLASTGSVPDLKAALIVLRQTLASAVDTAQSPTAVAPAAAGDSTSTTKPALDSPSLAPSQLVEVDGHEILPPQATLAAACWRSRQTGAGPEALLGAEAKSVTSGAALNLLQEALQEMPHAGWRHRDRHLAGWQERASHRRTPTRRHRRSAARCRRRNRSQPSIAPGAARDHRASSARRHRCGDRAPDLAAGRLAAGSARRERQPHRSHDAALEFRDSVRDAAGHRDGAVRDLARRRRQRGRGRQAHLAGAFLAQCRAGRARACADLADRRPHLGQDVGGAAADGVAASRRRERAQPGAEPGRAHARRHRDPRGHAAATAPAKAGHFLDRAP